MAKVIYANGTTSVILRVKILNTADSTGGGLTGLASNSSGLIVSTIADNEATATAYTGSNLETISTLGTFATPTGGKCRFREVDATNHPGLYEIQIANARWAVSNARSLIVTISGAENAAQVDAEIQLAPVPSNLLEMDGSTIPVQNAKSYYTGAFLLGSVNDATPSDSEFQLDAGKSTQDDFYNGCLLVFTSGDLTGISQKITGYTGSTKTVAFTTAFPTSPSDGDTLIIIGRIN